MSLQDFTHICGLNPKLDQIYITKCTRKSPKFPTVHQQQIETKLKPLLLECTLQLFGHLHFTKNQAVYEVISKANFKPAYRSKLSIFLSEISNLLFSFSFYFLQELSNPVLFGQCQCYFKKVEIFDSCFHVKLQFKYFNSLEQQQQCARSTGFFVKCKCPNSYSVEWHCATRIKYQFHAKKRHETNVLEHMNRQIVHSLCKVLHLALRIFSERSSRIAIHVAHNL